MVKASLWMRDYDLSLMARNEYIGEIVGASLGSVEEVDLEHVEVEWGSLCI